MGDVSCKQCGEPYSVYSLQHEVSDWPDQPDDAHDRFMSGEGCPTCDWGEKAGEVSRSRTEDAEELAAEHTMEMMRETDQDPLKFI